MFFKNDHKREDPKTKVKYFVKVKLHGLNSDDDMKLKQVLMIREPPVAYK